MSKTILLKNGCPPFRFGNAKNAIDRVQYLNMFSKDGWKRVHKACGHIIPDRHATHPDIENGNGISDFIEIWYDDNGIDEWEIPEGIDINEILVQRFVDYLQGD